MTKKKKSRKFEAKISHSKDRRSFVRRIKKVRTIESQNHPSNQATRYSGLRDSGDNVNDLIKSIIEEFSHIRTSDGLITGTNEVLRLLEREKLASVFIFKNKASFLIHASLHNICIQAGVPMVYLEEKDEHVLYRESSFPKSITYGIKKEAMNKLGNLKSLLELFTKRHKRYNKEDAASSTDKIASNEMKFPPTEETNQELLEPSHCYHTHRDVSKKSNSKETGFLSLNKFSTDERETDFLDYDSVACSGVLSIK